MDLYDRLIELCRNKGISGYKMCSDLGLSRGMMTDLKMGRKKNASAETLSKIATYFNVPVEHLLGKIEVSFPSPTPEEVLQDNVFAKLKKGLLVYGITDADVDFLLAVFKAHKEK